MPKLSYGADKEQGKASTKIVNNIQNETALGFIFLRMKHMIDHIKMRNINHKTRRTNIPSRKNTKVIRLRTRFQNGGMKKNESKVIWLVEFHYNSYKGLLPNIFTNKNKHTQKTIITVTKVYFQIYLQTKIKILRKQIHNIITQYKRDLQDFISNSYDRSSEHALFL